MNWIGVLLFGGLGILLLLLLCVSLFALWPRRHPFRETGRSIDEHRGFEITSGVVFDQNYPLLRTRFDMSDGGHIAARVVGPDDARDIIVLVHGIGSAGARWNNPAGLLSDATGARVVIVDLRGHNASSGRRHDLDHIGQYEDDLAQVVAQIRTDHPGARIWLAGHSMGGGILLRYALLPERPRVAGYLLLAPVFGPGPTAPRKPVPDGVFQLDRARLIALILLNRVGIRAFNHLSVGYLNAPPDFPAYSFTAIASGQPLPPQTAEDGLGAMEGAFLIVAGADDVAVAPEGYKQVAATCPQGHIEILPGLGHDSLLNSGKTYGTIASWLESRGHSAGEVEIA